MPQELEVLRCYKCNKFQVLIVKKVRKWQCKICSEKQSVKIIYGKGSGKECRELVQKLNLEQGEKEEQIKAMILYSSNEECDSEPETSDSTTIQSENTENKESKWGKFL